MSSKGSNDDKNDGRSEDSSSGSKTREKPKSKDDKNAGKVSDEAKGSDTGKKSGIGRSLLSSALRLITRDGESEKSKQKEKSILGKKSESDLENGSGKSQAEGTRSVKDGGSSGDFMIYFFFNRFKEEALFTGGFWF